MIWNCIKGIFPSKESVPISVTISVDDVKNSESANSLCTFFANIAQNLKWKHSNLETSFRKNYRPQLHQQKFLISVPYFCGKKT